MASSTVPWHMQLQQRRLRSGAWERLRGVHIEKSGSREQSWTKWQAEKEQAKEPDQESLGEDSKPTFRRGKWCWQCGKEGHIAAECPERRRAAKSLWRVNNDNKRQLKRPNHYRRFVKDYASSGQASHSSNKPKREVGMEQCSATSVQ